MGYSGLASSIIPSPNCTKPRTHRVDSVAIHTMAGNLTAEACGNLFASRGRNASSNYGIGSDGKIYGYVDENNRAWCTSNGGVDHRAISIEVASTTNSEPFACTAQAYESLIKLLVDICKRHNMTLKWLNDKSYALAASQGGPVDKQNMFVHRWFAAKSCPGGYLYSKQGEIANEVNRRLGQGGNFISPYTITSATSGGNYFMWPLPGVNYTPSPGNDFGPRNLGSGREKASKYHKGIDIAAKAGTNILACRGGKVVVSKMGYNGGRGNYIRIQHDSKYQTLYQHCTKLLVSEGMTVSAGQAIATVGNTGASYGNHLHLEVWVNGTPEDPSKYVKPTDTLANLSDNPVFSQLLDSVTNSVNILGKSKVIFIGDSRTVGMKQYVGSDDNIWSCKSGMGLTWMKQEGVSAIESKVSSDTGVAILLGINDLIYTDASKYSSYINECASRWIGKGASVYFVSVNPVRQSGYGSITNEKIQTWNQKVRDGLDANVGYIDTYSAIIESFSSLDGLHYDKQTSLDIYRIVVDTVHQGQSNMYANSAIIGGSPVQIDYTKLNPYVIRINENTPASFDYTKLQDVGVVGVYILAGSLYNPNNHVKKQTFKQKNFDYQRNKIEKANVEYGYFFHGLAQTIAEVQSEIYELSFIVRQHPPRLGVWVTLYSLSKNKKLNNSIVEAYQKQLLRLGLVGKIGIILKDRKDLELFDWDRFQDDWLLWIIDRVEDESDLKKLLDPEFFDMDGVG